MQRRTYLASIGSLATVALAGCSSSGDGSETPADTPTDRPTDTPTDTPTETPTEESTSTPTPSGPDIRITDHELIEYPERIYDYGVEVALVNDGDSPAGRVQVATDWLSDDSYQGTDSRSIRWLRPGEVWRTFVGHTGSGDPQNYDIYLQEVSQRVQLLNDRVEIIEQRYEDERAYLQVQAESDLTFVRVMVHGRNDQGEIVATGYTFKDIPADRVLRTEIRLRPNLPAENIDDLDVLFVS